MDKRRNNKWQRENVQTRHRSIYRRRMVNCSLKYGRIINKKSIYIGYIVEKQFNEKGKYIEFKQNTYEDFFSNHEKQGQGKNHFF